MIKRKYHITFSNNVKSANPLAKLLAGIIALAAIPVIFIAFAGVIAILLTIVAFIAAAVVFLKILAPNTKGHNVLEDVEHNMTNEADAAPSIRGKHIEIKGATRRKPVVIEQERDGSG